MCIYKHVLSLWGSWGGGAVLSAFHLQRKREGERETAREREHFLKPSVVDNVDVFREKASARAASAAAAIQCDTHRATHSHSHSCTRACVCTCAALSCHTTLDVCRNPRPLTPSAKPTHAAAKCLGSPTFSPPSPKDKSRRRTRAFGPRDVFFFFVKTFHTVANQALNKPLIAGTQSFRDSRTYRVSAT